MPNYIDNVMDYYMLTDYKVRDILTHLADIEQSDRLSHLMLPTTWGRRGFDGIVHGTKCNATDLKTFVNFYVSILSLLSKEDGLKLIEEAKDSLRNILFIVLTTDSISEPERLELTTTFCQLLNDYITPRLQQFLVEANLLRTARNAIHQNEQVIKLICALTGESQLKPGLYHCFQFFHTTQKPHYASCTSKVLRNNPVSNDERAQAVKQGKPILEKLLRKRADINTLIARETNYTHRTRDIEAYTMRCLSSESGLYALGSGLLTLSDAQFYAEKQTLEYFLVHQNLPFLRLYKPTELKTLAHYHLWDLMGDYAFIALEEKLIPLAQLAALEDPLQCSFLTQLCSYYGIIALREKLLSFEDCVKIWSKEGSWRWAGPSALFTENGIKAMRQGLYSPTDLLKAQSEHITLSTLLTPVALKQRAKVLAKEKAMGPSNQIIAL